MEPKDLKNSEELRSPENEDLKKVQADVVSDEVEKADAEETVTEHGGGCRGRKCFWERRSEGRSF